MAASGRRTRYMRSDKPPRLRVQSASIRNTIGKCNLTPVFSCFSAFYDVISRGCETTHEQEAFVSIEAI